MSLPFVERSEVRRVRDMLAPVEPGGSARQVYGAMLEHQIAPTLREWGLDGDGERFDYPSRVWHLSLAFVPVSWNTVSRFQFDVNVIAVSRVAWQQWRAHEPSLPESPDAAVYYAQDFVAGGGLVARLGELQRDGLDRRWTVHGGVDPAPVAAEVLTGLKRRVLPQFAGRAEARPLPA
ncbi:hypothetical protein [Demequina muriae]|uniref:DUF4304 domain-containing protein n=1 Tax=Demequina muriae TaxID=3051664 RepID=A0ABT8GHJ8_9MICO|nr:hypothetical protein [Demequina sp. EGI L300058]MDN4480917.1 hypothetical protein [Demequina sp. EGI L300058]